MPYNSSGYPDLTVPCNAVLAIELECTYGSAGLDLLTNGSDDAYDDTPTLSNSTQRDCVCESLFFSQFEACADCHTAHGASDAFEESDYSSPSAVSSLSSSYCAVTNTPTLALSDVLFNLATATASSQSGAAASNATSSFHDPIGNKTAVSYYYTPSVTGNAVYIVAQATNNANSTISSSASGSSSSASLHTSNGQIVPTASVSATESSGGTASGSAATASTTDNGAGKREAAVLSGVIALAAFVAMM